MAETLSRGDAVKDRFGTAGTVTAGGKRVKIAWDDGTSSSFDEDDLEDWGVERVAAGAAREAPPARGRRRSGAPTKRRSPFDKDYAPYGHYDGPLHTAANWRRAFDEAATATGALALLGGDDPWETLGVPRSADRDEARRAYKRLMREHHPDRGGNPATAERVIAAWTTIKDQRGWN